MSFFASLLQRRSLKRHDNRPLWAYSLSELEYEQLIVELTTAWAFDIDPRDVALYFSEWWKREYAGRKPAKQQVFDDLSKKGTPKFEPHIFYKLAKQGAESLGVKWIKKQNTLYFRSLLLQGGLPLNHISQNYSAYLNFLQAVLEVQPETLEDFIFNPHITKRLPASSRNDVIYENCFVIVKSILNEEETYDDLLTSNDSIKEISQVLKVRKKSLEQRKRLSKPQNYWLLSNKEGKVGISLRIGLADTYDRDSLSNMLGFDAEGREYQLYVDEELICVFRRMTNGQFKTDWFQQRNRSWKGENQLPHSYVIQEGEKIEVKDFIQTIPNLDEPSLWSRFSDDVWRLVKGRGTSNKEAALLFPALWKANKPTEDISILGKELKFLPFEGEQQIQSGEDILSFLSEVNSFDWTISSQKPEWMLKASMPVVRNRLKLNIYDEDNKVIHSSKYQISVKRHNSNGDWELYGERKILPLGCVDLKIEYVGLTALDSCFNIGDLQIEYPLKTIAKAEIQVRNLRPMEFRLEESEILEIEDKENAYSLSVKPEFSKIPKGVKAYVGYSNQKKLFFELASPFEGMAITDNEGRIIEENEKLFISNLHGFRILSPSNVETILSMKNSLQKQVVITKNIKEGSQPLITFLDEIKRLFYLEDAMKISNGVSLELSDETTSKSYQVWGFSHLPNIVDKVSDRITFEKPVDELDLYAVPLACEADKVELIPMIQEGLEYKLPPVDFAKQFVVISSKDWRNQLKPTFLNTDEDHVVRERAEHIEYYHQQLQESGFNDLMWRELLAYFHICVEHDVPLTTFYQIRGIARSSLVAARAFFFLGINSRDRDMYIQQTIPELEKVLGICFHWIKKADWESALHELNELYKIYSNQKLYEEIIKIPSDYMKENGLEEVWKSIIGQRVESQNIHHSDIRELRSKLGVKVLRELPSYTPKIRAQYHIPIYDHLPVKLLLKAPIAVAESINDIQQENPIWGGDYKRSIIRRNIQYSQYLNPEFYSKTILYVLNKS